MAKSLKKRLEEQGKLKELRQLAGLDDTSNNIKKINEPIETKTLNPVKSTVNNVNQRLNSMATNVVNNTFNTFNNVQARANNNMQSENQKWYQKFVQKSGAFDNGYQFGDISQTIGSSVLDVGLNVVKPFSDLGTGIANIGASGVAQVADVLGKDEFADRLRRAIGANESIVDKGIKLANKDSVVGDTSDALANAYGQYLTSALGGQVLGKASEVSLLGVKAPTTMMISSLGQGLKEGYSDKDYKNWEVWLNASGNAVIEGLTEGINDVLGVGGSKLSDLLKGSAMKPFKSGFAKALARTTLSSAEEGAEEVLSYLGNLALSNGIGNLEILLNQGDGEKWRKEFNKDEFWESFWVGTLGALMTEAPNTMINSNIQTQQAIQEQEKALGRELSKQERQKIGQNTLLQSEQAIQNELLGKNAQTAQNQAPTIENKPISNQSQQTIQQEGKIDEKAISQEVEQELKNTNYKREESVKRAFESAKKYNIDTKSDTFREKIRIADERGVDLVYDASVFGNNTNQNAVWKIKRDENGKIVSREIVFNPNAKGDMTLEQVWTHEITHDMEGNGKYKTMRSELLEYLQAKPEYEKAFNDLKAIYAKVYAEENLTEQEFNELIEDEVVADMLGSKLGDTEFLKSLNKEKRSLGKRIYDWVVDRLNRLNKKKGYTNEKLFWQDIKNKFENAYKEDFVDSSILTKYSVERDNKGRTLSKEQQEYFKDSKVRDKKGHLLEVYHTITNAVRQFNEFNPVGTKGYRFGNQVVNYYSDSLDMSGSYADQEYLDAETTRFTSIEQVEERLKNIGFINRMKLSIEENNGKYELYDYTGGNNEGTPRFTYNSKEDLFRNVIQDIMGENNYQYEGYLKLENPYVIDAEGQNWNHVAGKDLETNAKEMQVINSLTEVEKQFLIHVAVETASGKFKTEGIYEKDYPSIFLNAIESGEGDASAFNAGLKVVPDLDSLTEKIKSIWREYSKEHIYKLAYRGFTDSAMTTFENYAYTTNDIVHKVLEMNQNGANYDGVIIKNTTDYGGKAQNDNKPENVYVTFNSNQFKSYDNTKPTENPDIRYSLSQETKANLEAKIDRYSKLVDEMQKDGRDAEDWAPYANEILRLQDQLDGNRFSRESTGAWNEFKNKYGKNEGKGNRIQDITLQPKKISEVFKKNVLLDNTIKSKKYTGKKQTNNEIAKILDTPKERQKPEDRKWAILKANILDKGIVFEDLSKKAKNRELEAKWDYTLTSNSRGQYAIGNARYEDIDGKRTKVSKGLTEIIDEVGDKVSDFQNYMYHQLNIDRMSLEKNAQIEMQRMRENELKGYDENIIKNIARKRITENTTPERKVLITNAKEYVALSEVKNKPVFGKGVTEFHSKNKVAEFEKNNPQFKEWAKDVYDYLKADKMELVKNGVISEELSNKFEQLYPHYVPIQRVDKNGNTINVPLDTRRTGINTPIKQAKGGNSDINPLFQTMANRTMQTYRASARNSLGLELRKTLQQLNNYNGTDTKADLDNIIESMENESENNTLLQASLNGRLPTFTVFENGNKVTFDISEDIYDALKPKDSSSLTSRTFKLPNAISNIRRGVLTEYNPIFSITNTLKDTQDVLLNSQHPLKTYKKYPEAYQQIVQKGYWYEEYMQNGGEQNSYFKEGDFVQKEDSKVKSAIKIPFEKISEINGVMEMAPRLAEYIASRESGRSIQTSMLDASRVTTNFKAGGDVTKFLNRNGATFLNAGVQGTMQFARNIREAHNQGLKGYAMLACKTAIAGLPVLILNNLVWDDDEEYEQLQDYVKDSYYIVGKTKDGNFIRIPKGRGLAVIQKIVGNVNKYLNNKEELNIDNVSADFWATLKFAFDNIAPNNPLENNVLSPIAQVTTNTSWYGEDIVPERLQSVPKAEQYDETTDSFSIWLGDKLNVSPMKINYLLDQYGGGVADILLPMGTKQAENNVIEDKFTTNPTMKSKYPGEFFEKSDEIEVQSNSMNATDEDIVKNKYMADISGEMSKLYKEKRKIQNSDATDESKKEQLEKVQEQINEFAKTGIEEVDKAKVNQYIAEVGDKAYYKDDEGKWKKIDKEKDLVKGLSLETYADYKNKVAVETDKKRKAKNNDKATLSDSEKSQILLDSNYTEKEKRLMYPKYVGDDDKTYEYLSILTGNKVTIDQYLDYKTQGDALKATENEKSNIVGKTISGSKKKKVKQYIMDSDFSDIEKLYIYGSQYELNSREKSVFLQYVDNAKLDNDERNEILLKMKGTTEYKDGTITW